MKRVAMIITLMASSLLLPTVSANASSVSPALVSWVKSFQNGKWSACVSDWNYAMSHEDISNGLLLAQSHDYQQIIWNACGNLSHNSSSATLDQQISSFNSDMLNWVTDVDALNNNYYTKDYKKVNNDFSTIQSTISQILSSSDNPEVVVPSMTPTTTFYCPTMYCSGLRIISVKISDASLKVSWIPSKDFVAMHYMVWLVTASELNNLNHIKSTIHSSSLSANARSYTFKIAGSSCSATPCSSPAWNKTYYVVLRGWISNYWVIKAASTPLVKT